MDFYFVCFGRKMFQLFYGPQRFFRVTHFFYIYKGSLDSNIQWKEY